MKTKTKATISIIISALILIVINSSIGYRLPSYFSFNDMSVDRAVITFLYFFYCGVSSVLIGRYGYQFWYWYWEPRSEYMTKFLDKKDKI